MKTRNGFVSNSSSTSFPVTGSGNLLSRQFCLQDAKDNIDGNTLIINAKLADIEFGWGRGERYSWRDRVCFAAMQIVTLERDLEWKNQYRKSDESKARYLLDKTIKEYRVILFDAIFGHLNLGMAIDVGMGGYIDHASIEIFDSKETMIKFLFSEDSIIVLQNDNE